MKLLGTVTTSALEESEFLATLTAIRHQLESFIFPAKNPQSWVNPIKAQVKHDFQATNPQELSLRSGQAIYIAPREVQNTQKLLNTGWVLATLDNRSSGIIPLNYVQGPQQNVPKPVPSADGLQPKNMPEPDAGSTIVQNDTPVTGPGGDNSFPSMDSVMERPPEDIMNQVFARDAV